MASGSAAANPMEGMSAEERLHHRVLFRRKEEIEADIDEIIARNEFPTRHECAVHLLNKVLLPAMKGRGR